MDTMHTIFRSARGFFCGTFLSRLSGFARDIAMAFCFGGSAELAAFLVAFRLANIFRRVLGEGNLQGGFIPQFEGIRKGGFEGAVHFYRDAAFFLAWVSVGLVVGCGTALWGALGWLEASWKEIATLTIWMLPSLPFICLSGLHQAFLQSQKKYFWPSFMPAAFNGVWIVAAFFSGGVKTLALWVTLGSVVQWALSAIQVRRECLGVERRKVRWLSGDCRQLLQRMSLGLIGIAAVQINSALDAIFGRIADLSGPVYLWHAIRIQQLPLALFGLALSGAILPPLARAVEEGDEKRFCEFLGAALKRAVIFIIPCLFGMFALGHRGLNVLYGHGQFTDQDVWRTAECLWGYAAGLAPAVWIILLSQAFYAQKFYWAAAKASLIAVGINIFFNAVFVFGFGWGSMSVALATSISAWVNAYLLASKLPQKIERGVLTLSAKLCVASVGASLLTALFQFTCFTNGSGWEKAWQFATAGLLYLAIFLALSFWLKIEELFELFGKKKVPS